MGQGEGLLASDAPKLGWAQSPAGRRWHWRDVIPLGRCQFSCRHSRPDSAEWGRVGEERGEPASEPANGDHSSVH